MSETTSAMHQLAKMSASMLRPEAKLAIAIEAFELIAADGCENLTDEYGCLTDPDHKRGGENTADRWCPPCIARDALNRIGA